MVAEIGRRGHILIKAHPENPNDQGFDAVSWDPGARTLHLWEAKDYQSRAVSTASLSAFQNAWGEPTHVQIKRLGEAAARVHARERGREEFWADLLHQAPSEAARQAIKTAINEGRVEWHVRGQGATRFTNELKAEAQKTWPWSSFDVDNIDLTSVK